jgi:hypothetical protein
MSSSTRAKKEKNKKEFEIGVNKEAHIMMEENEISQGPPLSIKFLILIPSGESVAAISRRRSPVEY